MPQRTQRAQRVVLDVLCGNDPSSRQPQSIPRGKAADEAFQLVIWKEDAVGEHLGAAGFVRQPGPGRLIQTINVDVIDEMAAGGGAYRSAVVVVDINTEMRKIPPGEGR